MKWYYGNKIFLFYLQTMPLTGPIGLPCALNYTLNSASMCTFDVSTLDSINLQCPEHSTLIGQMCIGSCSASFIPSPTLRCVTNPELRENYRVPNETTSCPSGKTLRKLLSPASIAGTFCVPSSYQPVDSVPFCPLGYIKSNNQCYKPCSSSDLASNPPLCYAIYGDQYNPLPQSPTLTPVNTSVILPSPAPTTTTPTPVNTSVILPSPAPTTTTPTPVNTSVILPSPAPTTTIPTPVNTSVILPSPAPTTTTPTPVNTSVILPSPAPTTTTPTPVNTSVILPSPAPTTTTPTPVNTSVSQLTENTQQMNAFIICIVIAILFILF